MKIAEIENTKSESPESLPSRERRSLLRIGLAVTGVYLGGKVLSLTSVTNAFAEGVVPRLIVLWPSESESVEIAGHTVGAPYAERVRSGDISRVDVFF